MSLEKQVDLFLILLKIYRYKITNKYDLNIYEAPYYKIHFKHLYIPGFICIIITAQSLELYDSQYNNNVNLISKYKEKQDYNKYKILSTILEKRERKYI